MSAPSGPLGAGRGGRPAPLHDYPWLPTMATRGSAAMRYVGMDHHRAPSGGSAPGGAWVPAFSARHSVADAPRADSLICAHAGRQADGSHANECVCGAGRSCIVIHGGPTDRDAIMETAGWSTAAGAVDESRPWSTRVLRNRNTGRSHHARRRETRHQPGQQDHYRTPITTPQSGMNTQSP